MHANNKIGTLQPVAEIASIVKAHGALLTTEEEIDRAAKALAAAFASARESKKEL
ncbi:MAG: hypothetical protein NDI77_01165 [Geobacteraceae bacterium]|nr:hypothetical protein [Geobacteraceae bacterium]